MVTPFDHNKDEDKAVMLHELRAIIHDFKASVIAAEVAEAGLDLEKIFFRNQSSFRRRTSRDVEYISWNESEGFPTQLIFDLNREGIYDMLPEALVHSQTSRDAGQAVKQHNELKAQEKQARDFFSPLENEFAHRGLILDIIERELLKNDNPERNREFFEYFFGNSSMLTDKQVVILMHILPLCHKIRGDVALIGLTISRIIGYPITVASKWVSKKIAINNSGRKRANSDVLGIGLTLNDSCSVPVLTYDIAISDVYADSYKAFSERGKHYNVLSFILPYFFPADADVNISLHYTEREEKLMTFGDDAICFLGFNAYI